jgi:hypothetical protein
MRLGVPFIAPRQLGAVEDQHGRLSLPYVEWRTGQSGAPPDSYCSLSGADLLPFLAQTTVAAPGQLAHRTVRCPLSTVGAATRRPRIARSTVGANDCWLTGQSGAPPDSPVNYSHVAFSVSPERRVRYGRLTGQSGEPPDSLVNYSRTPSSSPESSLFTQTSLAHRTLSGAPPDSPVCQAELDFGCKQPSLLQLFSSLLFSASNT